MNSENFNFPKVSIITVVYNGAKTIEQTIKSVLNQSYSNIEYIIIDGGSNDGTLDIINKYESKIDIIVSEPDYGIYNAMNKGVMKSNGVLVGIINSDDWYDTTAVEVIVNEYIKNMNFGVFHGLLRTWNGNHLLNINGTSKYVLKNDSLPHPSTFIKKEIYELYGLYNEKYKFVADYELFLRFNKEGVSFLFIEQIIANFSIGGVSTISNKFLFEKFDLQYHYGNISFFKRIVLKTALIIRNTMLK
ncbi:glycosyltransferase family 2 protein [uncultured Flavobacterium sp.]|uniref:glycosyltransferase family 2 protein n=1 Tax=uncultured Flavobacterium sp. TaxID=165435 RepID=UPI0030EC42EB